jgi:hypothetical protein
MTVRPEGSPPKPTGDGPSHHRRSNLPASLRSVSIGSAVGGSCSPTLVPQCECVPEDDEGVQLLLGIANIVSKEMADSHTEIFDRYEDEQVGDEDGLSEEEDGEGFSAESGYERPVPSKGRSLQSPLSFMEDGGNDDDDDDDALFAWNRVRTVSMDSPTGHASAVERMSPPSLTLPAIVTPVSTRLRTMRKPSLKLTPRKKEHNVKFPKLPQLLQPMPSVLDHKRKTMEICAANGTSLKKIMRKKFSWKNYAGE